ncbi:MAG: glucose/arabinose dehydrogenase/plastocyanin [Rhodothermales bacterium]|jgi:glucose/arabinose dehydrogenase/plastocyanin
MLRIALILLLALPQLVCAQLTLAPQSRVAVVGGVLGERMQHDGWLETLLQQRFPRNKLSFRTLAVAGDTLTTQSRPEGFGSLDDHLSFCKADVILACFELDQASPALLSEQLAEFAEHLAGQQYNGKSAPKLILLSPIACEPGSNPALDAESANTALKPFVTAIAEFATAKKLPFVDLFSATLAAYEDGGPYTINGSFLNSAGNRLVAETIDHALFGEVPTERLEFEPIRQAVLAKNAQWFSRYRVADGARVFGSESRQVFGGLSNREVLLREQDIRAVMTENRDAAIWASSNGESYQIDDSNAPDPIAVPSAEAGPDRFADAESAIDFMQPEDGFEVSLFASESMFPELANPSALAFDGQGRLWVASVPSSTQVSPHESPMNKILVFADKDADGRADKMSVFASGLGVLTGFALLHDSVLVASPPDLLLLRDSDGDGVADSRERVLHGLGSADIDNAANSLQLGADGWLYFLEGAGQASQIPTPHGVLRNNAACVWRWHPQDWRAERHAPLALRGLRGQVVDSWGQRIVHDPMNGMGYQLLPATGKLDSGAHKAPRPLNPQATPGTVGTELVSSSHFPPEMQQQLLVCGRSIQRFELAWQGAERVSEEMAPLLVSSDENFRPVDLEFGPDGSLFIAEWHSPILGHQERHVRDPRRDSQHGRIYRLTARGRPLTAFQPVAEQRIAQLLELLPAAHARVALDAHPKETLIPALEAWVAALPADNMQARVEALWLYVRRNVVNETLLRALLQAPAAEARAAATRVLRHWTLPDDLDLLRVQIRDHDPPVRCEAVLATSFRPSAEAAAVALEVLNQPADPIIDHALRETIRQLNPYWRSAKTNGPLFADNPAGIAYVLSGLSGEELMKLPATAAVQQALLVRIDVPKEQRQEALAGLVKLTEKLPAALLVSALAAADDAGDDGYESVIADLGELLRSAIGEGIPPRAELQQLLATAHRSQTRKLLFGILIELDGNPSGVWSAAAASLPALLDFVAAVPKVPTAIRSSLFDYILPLMSELPATVKADPAETKAVHESALAALATIPGREAEKFAEFAALISLGTQVAKAVAAMRAIDAEKWPRDQILDAVDGIAIFARGRGPAGREEPDVVAALALGEALASVLPEAEAAKARERLQDLGGVTITISALARKLQYDVKSFTVEAGQPVELVFSNGDIVPRNLFIAAPGTLEQIGNHMDTRHEGRPPRILWSTEMLAPGSSERLTFTAPLEPGEYPFLCAMPDIWRSMSGVMKVVIP